jgi:MFS family permease
VALLASFSTLAAIDLLAAYLPAYGAARGISVRTVGLLLAAHGLASVLVRIAMMRLITRVGRRRLLTVSMLMAALMLALLPFVTWLPGLYLIMVVSGMGLGLCQPITLGWVAGQVRREIRGTAMSVRLAGNRLGQTVVPLAVGALAGAAGLAAAFVGPAALLAVGGVLVFRARGAGGG